MNNQYRTIAQRAGYADYTGNSSARGAAPRPRGRLRIDGADAASFLQALVSNDVAGLRPGRGAYATYLTPKGRMLADLEVYRQPDGFVCSLDATLTAPLADRLDQLVFSEDVRTTDVSGEIGEIVVVGGLAAEVLAEALAVSADSLGALPELGHLVLARGFVARVGEASLPSFKVFLPVEDLRTLTGQLEHSGIPVIDGPLLEALRLEHGRPAWGSELTEDTIPLEAGLLERAISTTKGCYVGQEVIIRILHRGGGRVARRLVKLTFDRPAPTAPGPGTALVAEDGSEAGRLTSVSRSPGADRWIALGYLHRDHAQSGRRFAVAGTDGTVTVTGLAG